MLKKFIVGSLVCLSVASASSNEYDLKTNMNLLGSEISQVQDAFLRGDKKVAIDGLEKLQKHIGPLFEEKNIKGMLPEDMKHKASIAENSAKMMAQSIDKIEGILKDRNLRAVDRSKNAQREFQNIQTQCFRCHNLVRDWK
jgi:hypothetical protein